MLKKGRANLVLLLVAIALFSCNAVKKVGEDEYLLTENEILIDSVKTKDPVIKNLISQKPNSNILGYPLRLNLYNLARTIQIRSTMYG